MNSSHHALSFFLSLTLPRRLQVVSCRTVQRVSPPLPLLPRLVVYVASLDVPD